MSDFLLQIFLFILGVMAEIWVFFLSDEGKKRFFRFSGILLIAISLIWIGFAMGSKSTSSPTITPTITMSIPTDSMSPSVAPSVGPLATERNLSSMAIEQFPVTIFVYDGRDKNLGGWSGLQISYLESIPRYQFSYTVLDTEQDGYAGMALQFTDGQNLSNYGQVEFTVRFDDAEAEHIINFSVSDISAQKTFIRVTVRGSGEQTESFLLTDFSNLNKNAVKEVTFSVDHSIVTGNHHVTISNIRFLH